jgi:excinuclease ABC subunit B
MHSDIDTLERIEIVNGLRLGEFDIIVGINLLREGLDLPEVKLVAILDADKEGFLRSEQALIQTIGRAARNAEGRVIMYADNVTGSMRRAIDITDKRRGIQTKYNEEHGITPASIIHRIKNTLEITKKTEDGADIAFKDIPKEIERLKFMMNEATAQLDFERAIIVRENISALRKKLSQ